MKSKNQEAKNLVDIAFQLVLTCTNPKYGGKEFINKTNEEKADWVRSNLRGCGYNISDPIGMSWGILLEAE